ncbi:MAG: hypothetical protein QOH26_1788 [Actinomycetota bacterium]|jgi:uncharacterized Zn finger protein (UPF0148 family)|nr:hypothetical protein [Actinomycetota bacterium]
MTIESCPKCGEPIVEGRLNCSKCGAMYPDISDRELTWDPSEDENKEE